MKRCRFNSKTQSVIAQLAAVAGVSTYAIEFVKIDDHASNFWGITFPSNPN
jgi:hypothetical protein